MFPNRDAVSSAGHRSDVNPSHLLESTMTTKDKSKRTNQAGGASSRSSGGGSGDGTPSVKLIIILGMVIADCIVLVFDTVQVALILI